MPVLKGQTATVTTTQGSLIPTSAGQTGVYTLSNDGAYSAYVMGNPTSVPALGSKTAAQLAALDPAPFELKAWEQVIVCAVSSLYFARASDAGGNTTLRLIPGKMTGVTNQPKPATAGAATTVSVLNTAGGTQLLAADSTRQSCTICNCGTENMWVSPGGTPAANTGVLLPPLLSKTFTPADGCRLLIKGFVATGPCNASVQACTAS